MSSTDEARRILAAGTSGPRDRIAVLICHGMGQQVPFETLGTVMDGLQQAQPNAKRALKGVSVGAPVVEILPDRARLTPVVKTTVTLPDGRERHVAMFECYWAPLTAGKVRLADAILFYIRAGSRGLRYGVFKRVFERRIGEKTYAFPLSLVVLLGLSLGLNTLMALTGWILLQEAFLLLAAWQFLRLPAFETLPLGHVGALVLGFFSLSLVGLLGACLISIALRVGGRRKPYPSPPVTAPGKRYSILRRGGQRVVSWVLIVGPVAGGLALLSWGYVPAASWLGQRLAHPLLTVVLAVALGYILFKSRLFLIEFTGDVAAYMSAHEVSRFASIRSSIQHCCLELAEFVYGLRTEQDEPFYSEVILVGHSLGSVVAYDLLNDLLIRHREHLRDQEYARRTTLFLTCGSPLDKIAFIFRSQKPGERLDVREDLAAERQPMLLSPETRPRRWINLWNSFDWIGAEVDYFDLVDEASKRHNREVVNLVESKLADPAHAHGGYWGRPLFRQILLWGVAGYPGDMPGPRDGLTVSDKPRKEKRHAATSPAGAPPAPSPP